MNRFVQQRFLNRLPKRNRPALYFDMWSNVGLGAYSSAVYPLALVVLERVLRADLSYQTLLTMMYVGSNLLSPLVTFVGRTVPMRLLVIVPNLIVAAMLVATVIPGLGPLAFTLIVGGSIVVRVFPRVAEMNMFRLLYPQTHRAQAISLTKSVGTAAGLFMTLVGWFWLSMFGQWYAAVFCLMALLMLMSAWFYSRIPVNRRTVFIQNESMHPWKAFRHGVSIFVKDRLFLKYQMIFAVAGIANHIALMLLPRVLGQHIGLSTGWITFLVAVLPNIVTIVAVQVWGRFLDGITPMFARAMLSVLQTTAFACYAFGGLTGQLWPIVIGIILLAVSTAGGIINWLSGSMYFAPADKVPLYNGVHVTLTGVRGMVGPMLGLVLYATDADFVGLKIPGFDLGPWVFAVSASMTLVSAILMFRLNSSVSRKAA